jgi:hypothetical protein
VEVAGRWIDNANFQVTIQAGVPLRLMPPLPGVPRDIATSVTAVANRVAPQFKTLPPTLSQLSPEAGDYNRISLYCYDPKRAGAADGGRRAVTPIADNGGTDFSRATLPECQPGEFPSYMNYNVRNARSSPSKWNGRNQEVYEYYADTARDENTGALRTTIAAFKVEDAGKPAERRVSFSVAQTPILETILCNTRDECRPKSERGSCPTTTRPAAPRPPPRAPARRASSCTTAGRTGRWATGTSTTSPRGVLPGGGEDLRQDGAAARSRVSPSPRSRALTNEESRPEGRSHLLQPREERAPTAAWCARPRWSGR